MKTEFSFSDIGIVSRLGEPMYFHSYKLVLDDDDDYHIHWSERLSANSAGLASAKGLKAPAKIELELTTKPLEAKISDSTLLTI